MAQQQQDTREATPVEQKDRFIFLSQQREFSTAQAGHATIDGSRASATFFKDSGTPQIAFHSGPFDFHLHPTVQELRLLASAYAQLANMAEDQQCAAALASPIKTDTAVIATEGGFV